MCRTTRPTMRRVWTHAPKVHTLRIGMGSGGLVQLWARRQTGIATAPNAGRTAAKPCAVRRRTRSASRNRLAGPCARPRVMQELQTCKILMAMFGHARSSAHGLRVLRLGLKGSAPPKEKIAETPSAVGIQVRSATNRMAIGHLADTTVRLERLLTWIGSQSGLAMKWECGLLGPARSHLVQLALGSRTRALGLETIAVRHGVVFG